MSSEDNRLVESGLGQQLCAVLAKPFSAIRMITKDYLNKGMIIMKLKTGNKREI